MSHKRTDPAGIAYYGRKLADGKGKKGALRCMKRRLSDGRLPSARPRPSQN